MTGRPPKALIIAGGRGTRMGPLTQEVPKPLLPVGGKPILEHQIELLRRHGLTDIHLLTGYLGQEIEKRFDDGRSLGVNLTYWREDKPLGTAGCLKPLQDELKEDFLVLYGDLMLDLSLAALLAFHRRQGGAATLVVHPNDHPHDSDLVVMDEAGRVTAILPKGRPEGDYRNLVSAAVYVLSPQVFPHIPEDRPSDLVADVFPAMLAQGWPLFGYLTTEYVKDMGTGARFEAVERDFASGRIERRSQRHQRPAVFLDRDGTLLKEVDLLHRLEDVALPASRSEAVRRLNRSDYLCFLATNQPVVARNLCSFEELRRIHDRVETLLGREGAYLDNIYSCPHHPDKGYPEENKALKIDCGCRKPKPGMLLQAAKDFNLDLAASWMIGDRTTDVLAGKNAGVWTVLVRTGQGGRDGKCGVTPDFVFDDLGQAVEFILQAKPRCDAEAEKSLARILGVEGRAIIAVGGLARGGKSAFVTCLRKKLQENGLSCQVLSLDNWVLGLKDRTPAMTVRERYRYDRIGADMDRLLKGETVSLDIYEPLSRTAESRRDLRMNSSRCLIIEGVPALDIPEVREAAHMKVYVEADETVRRERFQAYYEWKGLPPAEISALYASRQEDETPIIEASRSQADQIINGSAKQESP